VHYNRAMAANTRLQCAYVAAVVDKKIKTDQVVRRRVSQREHGTSRNTCS